MSICEYIYRECIEHDTELISAIRQTGADKNEIYSELKLCVFDSRIKKADLYFAFGSLSFEMEEFLEKDQLQRQKKGN